MPNMPNYTGMGIPSYDDLMGNLNEGSGLLGQFTSGADISSYFGLNPEKYGEFFNPINSSMIEQGLSQIPELQGYLYGQARNEYTQNRSQLSDEVGKTGLEGAGTMNKEYDKINQQFSSKMFSADKQVQDLVMQYQNQLNEEIGNLFGTAQNILAAGATPKDKYRPDYTPSQQELFYENMDNNPGPDINQLPNGLIGGFYNPFNGPDNNPTGG